MASVVSDSLQPHRRQPSRLPHPWNSSGKNTEVGCHFLLQCIKVKMKVKSLSRVQLLASPWTAAHQAPPSLGFLRQEHWSGLPFPSPMHESEKWKWSCSVVSDSSWSHGLQPTRLPHPWDFPGKSTGVGCHRLLQGAYQWTLNITLCLFPQPTHPPKVHGFMTSEVFSVFNFTFLNNTLLNE